MISYELQLTDTAGSTGYFSCLPAQAIDVGSALEYLRSHPNDEYMHRYLLKYLGYWSEDRMEATIREQSDDPVLMALCLEACLVVEKFRPRLSDFPKEIWPVLASYSPLIIIRSALDEKSADQRQWVEMFRANIEEHQALSPLVSDQTRTQLMEMNAECASGPHPVYLKDLAASQNQVRPTPGAGSLPSAKDTYETAMDRLRVLGILDGTEMRHISSLSPVGLLHRWRLSLRVENGRHAFFLTGLQTAYGKGLTAEDARASYSMEIVERCSSFAAASPEEGICDRMRPIPLLRGTHRDLSAGSIPVIHPDRFDTDIRYDDQPLNWLEAEQVTTSGREPVLIPAQCVFLFANFDEPALFSGLGSTGLASGNTPAQARLHGILEVFERHAEATTPYRHADCFLLTSDDPAISALLADYRSRGIYVWFQEIGQRFGVPCYKCFVSGAQGIAKGVSAHLDGKKAALSAMLETPFPYPENPPSRPQPSGLETRCLETLPNFSCGDPEKDGAILDSLLIENGYPPVTVDLTRSDLRLPVVRALVPGLALSADFDAFSRLHPHLIESYADRFQDV